MRINIQSPADLFYIIENDINTAIHNGDYQRRDALMDVLDFIRTMYVNSENSEDHLRNTKAVYDAVGVKTSYSKNPDRTYGWQKLRSIIEENDLLGTGWKVLEKTSV